ncbi:pilus assembly PilX family protein [Aromatoleum diolicum]|uniref:Type IV pilus assembly protein PilX n=1 Tax=Aromatoleum diolicum TaxID=75796 RepID=A0ABX1Q4A6_9RHOO|nr:hypothetical protein [Aromatoleum diolicum]NMG73191.1 hypothetical protein [Aromatoleum diolicum]
MESLNRRIRPRETAYRQKRQSGVVLIIALIVLALMSYAAASVIRSTDTGTLVAGNLAFRQATMHASDIALDQAWEDLVPGSYASRSNYFSTQQTASPNFSSAATIAADGVWDTAAVPCMDERGKTVDCTADTGGFRIQYVIERQCDSSPDLGSADSIKARCNLDPATAAKTAPDELGIYFRVITRARGPRGTVNYYEAMIVGPAV